jgi:hypothetical protein
LRRYNAESFSTFPKPLKDSSSAAWRGCRLSTSHQGQALQTIVRTDMARVGVPDRQFVSMGMFRDPVQFEQAAGPHTSSLSGPHLPAVAAVVAASLTLVLLMQSQLYTSQML